MNEIKINGKLVDAQELLNELFSDGCRPSLRWLRTQTAAKTSPHVRLGDLVFFGVEMVRAHVTERRLLRSRCLRVRQGTVRHGGHAEVAGWRDGVEGGAGAGRVGVS